VSEAEVLARPLVDLCAGRRVVALTGAGISTESGIPDYRGPGTRARAKDPMRFAEFTASPEGRARYWARAAVGWPAFSSAQPNAGHHAIAALERAGVVRHVITQNVDELHQRAGTRTIVELHGTLHRVRCLDCGAIEARADVQRRLALPPAGALHDRERLRPDGDAELDPTWIAGFVAPSCLRCGGVLKPDVVYFGETVPPERVATSYAWVEDAEVLLVVGSSLAVFSGYRFVRRAAERGTPIAIVNLGQTRGDPLAQLRIDASAGAVLDALARALAPDHVAAADYSG
jgi:NAD-dependent SIR2 family protein deacetylase